MNEKEFKELVSFAVEEIVAEKSKKGFIERLAGITAFVAAIGAFAGSIVAVNSAWDTLAKQEQIEITQAAIKKKQDLLDLNQKKLDENTRISRLWQTEGKSCASIPILENKKWESYLGCLEKDGVTNKKSDDPKRYSCIKIHGACST